MNEKSNNPFASMASLNPERGFTLVSTIVALMMMTMLLFWISQVMGAFFKQPRQNDMEVRQFFHFIEQESMNAISITIDESSLQWHYHNGDIVSMDQYQTNIRRQVNNAGHEIMLQNVESFLLSLSNNRNSITITIITESKETYEKTIYDVYPI
ncbi:ComGF family competence protein [Gracilibacillus sp. YIM 98692]|uniref:ComGF family competence protein n=1 Tax=Gracilibacillus sp. YIM 98692 TaxID=2663532 RepID=UPI0013D75E95|nr:ComGF family competence protein [Gracilibacillus sp. YIM 98692]